jgi:nucleoside-diphosphate-sugar epimerase
MKRVLVTGATGFIGTRAIPLLLERGYDVHALGRTSPPNENIKFYRCDVLNVEAARAAVAKIRATHLLHLAWDVTPGRYWQAAENLDWADAGMHLLQAFAGAGGRRAVFAGTCAEYEWGAPRFLEMTTPCIPATRYGTAKDTLRRQAEAYSASAGVSTGWGRIFYPFGPGEKSGRLVSDAIGALLDGKPFPTSHGEQRRDYLHVDDVAGAFAALLDSGVQRAVNIGSGHAVPIRTLLETIARLTGNALCLRFGERHLPDSEPAIIEADATRLNHEVGFVPRYDLDAGLADTVAWWRRQGR